MANNYIDPTGALYGPSFVGQYNGSGQDPTNGATSSGTNVLHFSSTAQPFWQYNSVSVGALVYDLTNPSAIPVGTTVTAVGSTTVTMSANATGAGVANGDIIRVGDGPYSGTVTTFNNINMLTGTPYAQDVTSVTKVVSSPSTGTEFPGNTITLTLDFSAAVTVTGHADADIQRRRHRDLYRRHRHQCADLQLHGWSERQHCRESGDHAGEPAERGNDQRHRWQRRQSYQRADDVVGPTDRSAVRSDAEFDRGVALERRPQCRQHRHADART